MKKINILNPFRRVIDKNFHALTHKNFRYFWLGQCVSLIGTWMQSIGQAWLVYSLTNSPFLLGLLGALQFLPVTFLSLFAGVFIDKFPKKKILLATQGSSMVLALVLAALVFTGTARYEYILVIAVLLGITNSIDMPARQSFMIEIAGREDLMNALALNSAIFNLAKVLGPSIGAVLLGVLGAGWCFLLNGISFTAVIYGLLKIRVEPYVRENKTDNVINEIADGLRYIFKHKVLIQPLLLVLVIGILGYNYSVILPVFVKSILHKEAAAYGILMAAIGIGSVFGALTVSRTAKTGSRVKVMVISSVIVGALFIMNGFTSQYVVTIAILTVVGVFSIYFATNANTTLQMNSKDEYRGRVMSVYSMVFAGATPIGSIFTGTVITSLGVADTLKVSGALIIFLTGVVILMFVNRKSAIGISEKVA